ncbi:response regulator transcription factor [Capillimicrobium parvum]|uniref:Transcriptional regulatory protein LiaR n=1 Tax=Capillimicrobium parvum TaxID=2884022 RepID=A0A9E6XT49_9ACTN|nr:response regulator transcription factor [Capillimicrobium parvum]UGS34054.1 Transcriptional regulatory protein LiaR [Capillimicrobium parvum]
MIRVLVVDDHPVVRAGLEAVLRAEPGIVPIGSAVGPKDALALVRRGQPDVVLLDARLGPHDGLDVCRELLTEPSPPAVLVISANVDPELDAAARAAGARGAVDKSTDLHVLFDAIRLASRPAQAA